MSSSELVNFERLNWGQNIKENWNTEIPTYWHNQSLWSSFKLYSSEVLLLSNQVRIETKSLTITELKNENKRRLEVVWDLSEKGYSPKEISVYLNENGFKRKYSNKPFNRLDVGMMKLKYKRRLESIKDINVNIGKWKVRFFR